MEKPSGEKWELDQGCLVEHNSSTRSNPEVVWGV